jgi:EmrB/QacA subfamily drug resistance transporter
MAEPQPLTQQQKMLTLAGTLLAMFLAALDQTVVSTAGPQIQRDLEMAPSLYTWITTAYLVSSTVLVPVYGKLSDLYGRKRIILFGVTVFLAASALCGFAQSAEQLIAARALQGIGSGSLFTTAFAIVADLFPPSERGKYSGLFGAVFGVSSLIGPLLGGFITDAFGWHWIFFINLPLGAIAIGFIVARMPALKPTLAQPPHIDIIGALLLGIGVVPFLLACSFGRAVLRAGDFGYTWASPQILALFAIAAVGTVGFVFWELRAAQPLVDLRLFGNRMVAWGSASMFVLGAAFLTPMVFLPLYMVNVVGVTNTASGLTISPLVLGIVAGNIVSGQLVSRLGRYKPLMLISLVVLGLGFTIMGFTLRPDSTQAEVTLKMVVVGLGLGPSIPLYTLAIQNAVSPQAIGVATSMSTFFRQMGSTVGIAIIGSLFATSLSEAMTSRMIEATRGLPPEMVQRFASNEAGASEEGAAVGKAFDATAIKARIDVQLDNAKQVAIKAINGETLAAAVVAKAAFADDRLKAIAANGGVKAQVRKAFETMNERIAQGAQSTEGWLALQAADDLPPDVAAAIRAVPPADRQAQLKVITDAVEQARVQAEGRGLAQALAAVGEAIEGQKPRLHAAVNAVGKAQKEAFTIAVSGVYRVAIALALLALVLTLRLPVLPLRTSNTAAPIGE